MGSSALKRRRVYFVVGGVFFVLVGYVLYPFFRTLVESLTHAGTFSLATYARFFDLAHPNNLRALGNSLLLSCASVVMCGIVGTGLAFFFHKYRFPGSSVFSMLVLLPLVFPPLISVISYIFLYGKFGIVPRLIQQAFHLRRPPFYIQGFWGILLIHVYTQYVFFYMTVSAALSRIDRSVEEAAHVLGAPRFYVFRRVTLPLLTPALISGALLVFMTSMASFSAPYFLGGRFRVLSMQIFISRMNGDMKMVAVQSTILGLVAIVMLLLMRWYERRSEYVATGKGIAMPPQPVRSRWVKGVAFLVGCLLMLILIAPHFMLLLMSLVPDGTWGAEIFPPVLNFSNYRKVLSDSAVVIPIRNSLLMGGIVTAAALVFGTTVAYLTTKRRFVGRGLMEALTMLPWALPGTVIAVNLIMAFTFGTPFTFGAALLGTVALLPVAYFIKYVPLVLRSTSTSFALLDDSQLESARTLGAGGLYAFRRVVLPAILPGMLAGALLAFISVFGEFTMSILLYIIPNRPVSIAIEALMRYDRLGLASVIGVFQVILMTIVLVINNFVVGERSRRAFF